jgi:Bacterial Ig domain/IPTL-CTERM motif
VDWKFGAEFCSLTAWRRAPRNLRFVRIARTAAVLVAAFTVAAGTASAQNPGDPLFCQPNEGDSFLIVNGGGGIFTADPDCYNNTILTTPPPATIATSQGGTLTLHNTASAGNYTYTPPTPGFTGTDTFSIPVLTVWNSAGGTGSAGGAARPGGPATLVITLNVIPATTTLSVVEGTATLVPVPAGSITGCGAQGNPGAGPPPGAVPGCITRIVLGGVSPSHGTISTSGNTLQYTPAAAYTGPDTFTYQALGINTDGPNALNSGNVTVNVTVNAPAVTSVPTLGEWGMFLLFGLLMLYGARAAVRRPA